MKRKLIFREEKIPRNILSANQFKKSIQSEKDKEKEGDDLKKSTSEKILYEPCTNKAFEI